MTTVTLARLGKGGFKKKKKKRAPDLQHNPKTRFGGWVTGTERADHTRWEPAPLQQQSRDTGDKKNWPCNLCWAPRKQPRFPTTMPTRRPGLLGFRWHLMVVTAVFMSLRWNQERCGISAARSLRNVPGNFPTSVIQGRELGGGWSWWWESRSKLSAWDFPSGIMVKTLSFSAGGMTWFRSLVRELGSHKPKKPQDIKQRSNIVTNSMKT